MGMTHYFRCCLNCGSLFPVRDTFLCQSCWSLVNADLATAKTQRASRVVGEKIESYILWNWIPSKNDALSEMLVALKGWSGRSEWDFLARRMLEQRLQVGGVWMSDFEKGVGQTIIVPAPSLRAAKKDHTLNLARALAQLLPFEMMPLLQKFRADDEVGTTHQRGRTRAARQQILMKKHEKFSQLDLSKSRVILIDDVLTTGETAAACLKALSPLKTHEIWCLAQRALI